MATGEGGEVLAPRTLDLPPGSAEDERGQVRQEAPESPVRRGEARSDQPAAGAERLMRPVSFLDRDRPRSVDRRSKAPREARPAAPPGHATELRSPATVCRQTPLDAGHPRPVRRLGRS